MSWNSRMFWNVRAMPNSTILWVGLPVMSFRSKMTSPESGR